MTETRPTQEDFARALKWAQSNPTPCDPGSFQDLLNHVARCYRALAAENKALEERVRTLSRSGEPWDLRSTVAKLAESATVLLRDKDYDAHGWETINAARVAAFEWLGLEEALAADDAKAAGEPVAKPEHRYETPDGGYAFLVPARDDRASSRLAYVREKAPVILAGSCADPTATDIDWADIRREAIEQAGLIFDETESE